MIMTRSSRCSFCGIEPNEFVDTLMALPTPALDELLSSNCPPTYSMEITVKAQLIHVQGRIKILDEAIENLQKARSSLKQQEVNLTSVLSPIRRVPPEILSEIFTHHNGDWWERLSEWQLRGALPTNEYMGWDDFEDTRSWDGWMDDETRDKKPGWDLMDLALRPTNVLSHVCHRWRAVARVCSSLWSNISLHCDYRLPGAQTRLKEQVHLSANRPLRIHTSYQFTDYQYLFPLIEDILPTSFRWTSISMVIGEVDHPVFPRSTIHCTFPSLVSLSLIIMRPSGSGQHNDDVNHIYKITAADLPLLREVSLSWPDESMATIDLPWAQLHKLRFWGVEGARAVGIISSLREILELDLLGVATYDHLLDPLPLRSLHLPHLRCLRLSNVGCPSSMSDTPGMILPHLNVPSLTTLYWTGMKPDEVGELYAMCEPWISETGEVHDKGQQVLQHLHLYNPARGVLEEPKILPRQSWGTLLLAIGPQLESFKIEYPTASGTNVSEFVELFAEHIRDGNLPHFHACTLQGVHVDSSPLADLIACVESHKCDIRVHNCTFDTQEELDDAFITKLQESFPEVRPDGAFFELDVETPNRKRLFYTSESGPGLEESCGCRSKGMLHKDERSSVLRVV